MKRWNERTEAQVRKIWEQKHSSPCVFSPYTVENGVGKHYLDTMFQDKQSTVQVSASSVKQSSQNLSPRSKPRIVFSIGASFHMPTVSPTSSRYV